MSTAEWKCPCGQWVSTRYPAHTHALIPTKYDPVLKRSVSQLGMPHRQETVEREPNYETRAHDIHDGAP